MLLIIFKKLLRFVCTFYAKKKLKKYGCQLIVNFPCKFNGNTRVGDNCNFNGIKVFGGGTLTIGDHFHSGKNIEIYTDSHNYEGDAIPYDSTNICYSCEIGDNVWIGSGVKILGNVKIEEGVIIQAGSVVVKDIPYCAIAGGNPAKVFKYRDMEHYNKLKSELKFH